MYRFYVNSRINDKHYADMLRLFFTENEFELLTLDYPAGTELTLDEESFWVNRDKSTDRNEIKTELYKLGKELTGITSEWGILTGVRPLKLAFDVREALSSDDEFERIMKEKYLVSDRKLRLITEIMDYQRKHIAPPDRRAALYVHIPFCPTKCTYCSFASEELECSTEADRYLECLYREIEHGASLCRANGVEFESAYIGGGTPTVLNEKQLDELLSRLSSEFGIVPERMEFTLEAGRPDTITEGKLDIIRGHGISRISINPQSMHDETLKEIGRSHSTRQIEETFRLADRYGFKCVNADLIAGLSDETPSDFHYSLERIA